MAYADYTFYSTVYSGAMPETDFDKYEPLATMHIDNITFNTAQTAPTEMETMLKYACCEYADLIKSKEDTNTSTSNGTLASESNDGFSQSYKSGEDLQKAYIARDNEIACKYLTFPFNLMYGGR